MVPPQVLVSANGALALTEETVAAVLPGLETVTVCAALVDPVATLPNDRLRGDALRGLLVGPVPPPPGNTSNSDSWAALQPVLPVKLSCTYSAVVPDGRLIVTSLPVEGLKV